MIKVKQPEFKINNRIRSATIRIVGENIDTKIVSLDEGLQLAEKMGLDLIEINSVSDPIVCKIMDYNKFIYEKKKKDKDNKKKQVNQEMKEIRFTPNISEHDFNFKLKHVENFLNDGDIVKAIVLFKGREKTFQEKGQLVLMNLANSLIDISLPDNSNPQLEGNKMTIILKPKKRKNK